jgi:hypothetical protein
MARRKAVPIVLFAVLGVGVYSFLAPKFPKDQTVNVVLGDAAPKVTDLTMRYVRSGEREADREATFHFAQGTPRIVRHDAQLPDGDYRVELDLRGDHTHTELSRNVTFFGGSTSIDVSEAAKSALAEAEK